MKKRDILLAVALIAIAVCFFSASRLATGGIGTAFVVAVDGQELLRGSLQQNGTYPIQQEDGSLNVLSVSDGYVFMQEANCRDQICMKQGRTNTMAKTIVCLPHGLTVSVVKSTDTNEEPADLDIVIR